MPGEYTLYLVAGMRHSSEALTLAKSCGSRVDVKWANTDKIPVWLTQIPTLHHTSTEKVWSGPDVLSQLQGMVETKPKIRSTLPKVPVLPGYANYSEKSPRSVPNLPTYSSTVPTYSSTLPVFSSTPRSQPVVSFG